MSEQSQVNTKRERAEYLVIRLLFMILFFIIYRICSLVLFITSLVQYCFQVFKGESHSGLSSFNKSLSLYIFAQAKFLSFQEEDKPYPFTDWPKGDSEFSEVSEIEEIKDQDD